MRECSQPEAPLPRELGKERAGCLDWMALRAMHARESRRLSPRRREPWVANAGAWRAPPNVRVSPSSAPQVIPMLSGDATDQIPPDLPSYLFKERIVYLGMSLVPSGKRPASGRPSDAPPRTCILIQSLCVPRAVTELMMAELLYLQYDNPTKPVYLYINSTGVTKGGPSLGYEAEAFAIYDCMKFIKPPVHTCAVG